MSVVTPPERPPEVQRPYDQGSTPRAPRVSTYRHWTRAQQAVQAVVIVVAVVVSVVSGALAGVTWASSVTEVALTLLALTAVMGTVNTLIERSGVRRALAGAEPLPDGAIELPMRPLGVILTEPRFVLIGALVGGAATLIALVLDGADIAGMVSALAGVCVGRVVSLELLLRRLVERAQPGREYLVELDPDPAPWAPPLLWRPQP